MTEAAGHVTHLRLVGPVPPHADPCALAAVERAVWLGTPVPSPRSDMHRFLTDLSLPVHDRAPHLTFRKAAHVDLGSAHPTREGCELEVSWQSASFAPLFPVFAGKLTVTATEIALDGFYAPPGGEIGAALDRAFLNVAARGTARWFMSQVLATLHAVASAEGPEQATPSAVLVKPFHGV